MKSRSGRPSDGTHSRNWGAGFASRWGNSPPNRWADLAGRHRRLAVGSALLTVPFVVMAAAPSESYSDRLFSAAHLLAAVSLLWLAWDLVRFASLVSAWRLPHASIVALAVSFWVLYRHRTEQFEMLVENQPLLLPGVAMIGLAIGVMVLADRNPQPQLYSGIGRLLLVSSAVPVGVATTVGVIVGLRFGVYSVGVALASVLLVTIALFEGRLLWRAVALVVQLR